MMKWLILILLYTSSVYAIGINKYDNPSRLRENLIRDFTLLSSKGEIGDKKIAWPGYHWPSHLGSIANRWSAKNSENFKYQLNDLASLKELHKYKLAELSPAEKFDIYTGKYSYPTVYRIRKNNSPYQTDWFGLCHGTAAAAMSFEEPETITVTNDDGITLDFYASDLKALLSYYYAKYSRTRSRQVGKRCYRSTSSSSQCSGINPGTLYILLTNYLGDKNEPFLMDIDRYNQVWNHVAVKYSNYIVNESEVTRSSSPKAVRRLRVQTEVKFAGIIAPKFDAVLGTDNATFFDQNYDYYIELDKKNKIVGGEWISDTRPDFIWVREKATFSGTWTKLYDLVQN